MQEPDKQKLRRIMTLALILNGVLDPKEALDNVNPFIKDELYEALEVADYV